MIANLVDRVLRVLFGDVEVEPIVIDWSEVMQDLDYGRAAG